MTPNEYSIFCTAGKRNIKVNHCQFDGLAYVNVFFPTVLCNFNFLLGHHHSPVYHPWFS